MQVAIAMGVVANNKCCDVIGAATNTSPNNGRRGDSNRLTRATRFHLHAIASAAMNAALVGDGDALPRRHWEHLPKPCCVCDYWEYLPKPCNVCGFVFFRRGFP
jgi:hypothetical protein